MHNSCMVTLLTKSFDNSNAFQEADQGYNYNGDTHFLKQVCCVRACMCICMDIWEA